MFKKFHLNRDYEFNYSGECKLKGSKMPITGESITIDVFGESITYDKTHLGLCVHFRFNPLIVNYDNINFVKVTSRVLKMKCGHVPFFKSPVEVGYGFRLIPGFSQFAINHLGAVLSYRTGNVLKETNDFYGYPTVSIYDPDKERWRSVGVHVLIARAFIENQDPETKIYVNHKNGNKLDKSINNLEWSSAKENTVHAISTGLSNPSKACTLHDIMTGESFDYPSVAMAMKAKNITSNYSGMVRRVGDETFPRVYAKRYVLTDVGVNFDDLKIIDGAPQSRTPNSGPYQAIEVDTGIVIECNTLKELSMSTGVPYDHVRSIVENPSPKQSGGFHFRSKTDLRIPETYESLVKLKARSFVIDNGISGEVKKLKSLSALTKFLTVDKATVYRRLRDNKPCGEWNIREVESYSPS